MPVTLSMMYKRRTVPATIVTVLQARRAGSAVKSGHSGKAAGNPAGANPVVENQAEAADVKSSAALLKKSAE